MILTSTTRRTLGSAFAVFAAGVLTLASTATAQLPSRHTNLKLLPSNLERDSLLAIMGGFTRALGVRCTHCHVARDGVRPAADEFASDEREQKRVARAMLQMVAEINGRLMSATGRDPATIARVTCFTCHHGVPQPIPLEEMLRVNYERAGLDSTTALYRALRVRYFGSAAYDFSDVTLPTLADRVAETPAKRADAVALMRLNLEFHPASWFTFQQLGQLQAAMGDTLAAIQSIERGLVINPQRPFLRDLLQALRKR